MSGDRGRAAELLTALDDYRPARQRFLTSLGLPMSNRDPFAEFGEQFVCALMGGTMALSRVQLGHDFELPDGRKVQVRYLANPAGGWINEHLVHRIAGVSLYALVILEAFAVTGVVLFPIDDLSAVGAALGKRHPRQDETLQFTRRNWWALRDNPNRFTPLGVQVWLPPFAGQA